MRVGAIILPMESRWTATERSKLCATFRPDIIVTNDPGLSADGIETVLVDAEWMERSLRTRPISDWSTTSESPVLLSLSSGTTGIPKGPLVTHGLAMRRLIYESASMGFASYEVNMCAAPLYFGAGR